MLIFKARNTLRTEEHHLCTVHAAISSFFFFSEEGLGSCSDSGLLVIKPVEVDKSVLTG